MGLVAALMHGRVALHVTRKLKQRKLEQTLQLLKVNLPQPARGEGAGRGNRDHADGAVGPSSCSRKYKAQFVLVVLLVSVSYLSITFN